MNLKRLKIACDVDEVICLLFAHTLEYAKQIGWVAPGATIEDWKAWNEVDRFIPGFTDERMMWIFTHTDVYRTAASDTWGIPCLSRLRVIGHQVDLVTHRNFYEGIEEDTYRWLREKGAHYDNVYFIPAEQKAEFCKGLGYDCIIDDKWETIAACRELGVHGLLVDRPHNRDVDAPGLTRVSMHDLYMLGEDILQKLLRGSQCEN